MRLGKECIYSSSHDLPGEVAYTAGHGATSFLVLEASGHHLEPL